MPDASDVEAFRKGMAMLSVNRYEEAVAHFEAAMKLVSDSQVVNRRMRYLSYYGLSVALADRPTKAAIKACEVAAKSNFFSAEMQLNLGKVYNLAGKTTRALAAFERGLQRSPNSEALKAEIAAAERRKQPPLRWLHRNHPLNRFLGKARARFFSSRPSDKTASARA